MLYQASVKRKDNEVNFIESADDSTHLDASDFTDDFDEKIVGDN